MEYDQESVRAEVPRNAKSHVVVGDVYRNNWLGITLRKPSRFKFVKLDAIYPDRAVLGLEGPAKALGELRQLDLGIGDGSCAACLARLHGVVPDGTESEIPMSGKIAVAVANGRKAACAVVDRADVWVLMVEAENAAGLLRELAAGLELGVPRPISPALEH